MPLMKLLASDLVSIVEDIFLTMLSMGVEVEDIPMQESGDPIVTACMHLEGAWKGAVLLQCRVPAASEFTASMLGIPQPASADDDVKDAMGELINMIAGNFKGLLGGGVCLSLPTVVEGLDYRFHILRGGQTACIGFRTPAGPVHVSLVETREPPKSPTEALP